MRIFVSLLCGLIFGFGLIVSGMANPAKVQNFLDIFGAWDPSLAFVMGGAIMVTMPGLFFAGQKSKPLLAQTFQLPNKSDLDQNLIVGAGTFGIGWGMVGLCPGPALVALGSALPGIVIFVLSLLFGLIISKYIKMIPTKPLRD